MQNIIPIELPTVTGMKTVNVYLIKGDCITLFDAGEWTEQSFHTLQEELKSHRLQVSDIEEIIISHAHVDHIGGAGRIAEESGASVKMSDLVYPWAADLEAQWERRSGLIQATMRSLLAPDEFQGALHMFEGMKSVMMGLWTSIPLELIETFPSTSDEILISGQPWKCIYAPGHSFTQHCFYNSKSRKLLAADMILKITPTPVIERSAHDPAIRDKSIITLLQSFQKFQDLDIAKCYPGHYELITDVQQNIQHQITRIHRKKETTCELIQSGHHTFLSIFQKLYKGRMGLPAFNMLVGYLDLLEEEGRIRFERRDGFLWLFPS